MSLRARIAQILGWSEKEVQTFSLLALRDLVAPISPKTAHEITVIVRTAKVLKTY